MLLYIEVAFKQPCFASLNQPIHITPSKRPKITARRFIVFLSRRAAASTDFFVRSEENKKIRTTVTGGGGQGVGEKGR